jgi:hypothetical protein
MATRYDRIEQRLMTILSKQDADDLFRGEANLKRYLKYLKENLAFPCLLTGMEDFPWEERYVFGYGDKREYEKLKKTNPSYTDTFSLHGSENLALEAGRIYTTVERISDKKWFVLPLEDLEAKGRKSPNRQLIEDYSYWFVNYQ